MDPQQHAYSSSYSGTGDRYPASQGSMSYTAQALHGIKNNSVPRLPGIGRGDGVGERQPLSSLPGLTYHNAQVTGNKRNHGEFSPDAFYEPRASPLIHQPSQPRAPGWSSPISGSDLKAEW